MKKDFAILTFDDIDAFFLQKYIDYLNGYNVNNKLKKLRRVFRKANKGIAVFDSVKLSVKPDDKIIKLDCAMIDKIEFMDRSILTEKEDFCVDLFLFGYYTGGQQ